MRVETHPVNVEVHLGGRLELSVQGGDAAGPHQVLHFVLEDQQLDAELLLRHIQEPSQLGHGHGGVKLQETRGRRREGRRV